jgi:glutamate dehydrogenase/leucine dehydrogenase
MTNIKQETIEEAAERILSKEGIKRHPSGLETYLKGNVINAMVEMAKWQAERMYSEEEVKQEIKKL